MVNIPRHLPVLARYLWTGNVHLQIRDCLKRHDWPALLALYETIWGADLVAEMDQEEKQFVEWLNRTQNGFLQGMELQKFS